MHGKGYSESRWVAQLGVGWWLVEEEEEEEEEATIDLRFTSGSVWSVRV